MRIDLPSKVQALGLPMLHVSTSQPDERHQPLAEVA
jgi:hypothetical protein